MVANPNDEQQEDPTAARSSRTQLGDIIPVYIPGVDTTLAPHGPRKRRFLDFLKAHPSREWLLKFRIRGRMPTFTPSRHRQGRSRPDPAIPPPRRRFRVPFVRKINWKFLIQYGKNWIKHPMNMALLVWLLFVLAGLVVLALLMTGLLDEAIPKSSQRKRWTEIVNQILNALFTIMCLYQHPKIFHHLVILCRWAPKDAVELRMVYCKTSAKRPYERAHMAFIIALLHITCFSQYVLCALYWGWSRKTRPGWAENTCIGLGIASPVIAGLYTVYSPLGRKIGPEEPEAEPITDEESQGGGRVRVVVTEPEWLGGLFDCCDDATVAYFSFFCTFCVFGWNMERLGFGNMYVHIVTFILLCIAPVLVFSISALNISDDTLKYTVGITGCVLCFCGLLYGGFWRIQMRKKFRLPGSLFCCGYAAVTDCFQWLFCWACSLAQEVRTGNFYVIDDDSFYRRDLMEPLPREGQAGPRTESSLEQISEDSMETASESSVELLSAAVDQAMSAPAPVLIQLEECQEAKESKQ